MTTNQASDFYYTNCFPGDVAYEYSTLSTLLRKYGLARGLASGNLHLALAQMSSAWKAACCGSAYEATEYMRQAGDSVGRALEVM